MGPARVHKYVPDPRGHGEGSKAIENLKAWGFAAVCHRLQDSNICCRFSLQLQRKLEIENDSKRKLELLVKERDRQLEMETMTRRDVESNKNHITDRVSSLEKLVSTFVLLPYAYATSNKLPHPPPQS